MNALWAAVGDHARPNSATHAADPRQRGDRIKMQYVAVRESAPAVYTFLAYLYDIFELFLI
jgi:hypothetical protein